MKIGRGAYVTLANTWTLGRRYGQYRTARLHRCLDRTGGEIPWYTYPAIEYIGNHRLTNLAVLEYGSGYSSLYYAQRGAAVTSIEDDRSWFDEISGRERNRPTPQFSCKFAATPQDYVERPEVDTADIVVIDGSHRTACTDFVASRVESGDCAPAWVVFDNSDWYPVAINDLDRRLAWPRADFCGFGPINAYTWVTSIFLNPAKRLPRNGGISSLDGKMAAGPEAAR